LHLKQQHKGEGNGRKGWRGYLLWSRVLSGLIWAGWWREMCGPGQGQILVDPMLKSLVNIIVFTLFTIFFLIIYDFTSKCARALLRVNARLLELILYLYLFYI
jgi:hypothetical protein